MSPLDMLILFFFALVTVQAIKMTIEHYKE